MNTRALMLSLVALGATVIPACKSKSSDAPQGSAPGGSAATGVPPQGSADPVPPAQRPSQGPLPLMQGLKRDEDPARRDKIALGNALFFDKRLSGASDRACYSCHQNEDGNGGHDPIAIGSGDKVLTRHSPVIWNVAHFINAFYWDGRANTLEDTARAAWAGGNMGAAAGAETPETTTAALDKKAAEIAAIAGYKKLFAAAFPKTVIKAEHVTRALAEYMRTLICNDTAYDKFAAGDNAALTADQQRGLDVFLGKGRCVTCHAPPYFSTAMNIDGGVYFNAGIGTAGVADDQVDVGRMKVTNTPEDWAAFKPPSLRNVTRSAPYFHNGSAATLEEAVTIMSTGGIANKNKTPLLTDAGLTDAERTDLIAFLGGLACPGSLQAPTLP
jgi:cytochrome c peroxidase